MAARNFLITELAKPFAGPTVIVTHHLPSMQSVAARFKNDVPSAAYASHLDELVANSNAALWIHGHAHNSSDYVIGGTRVLCNPRDNSVPNSSSKSERAASRARTMHRYIRQ